MHSALLIDEILRLVFSFASETGPSTLAVAARCCKAWRDPALDFLWNRLSCFKPFVLLFSGGSVVNGEFVLPSYLPEQDLSRFNFYAGRIKHAGNRYELRVCFGAEAMALFHFHHKSIVLPNLSSVHISVSRCPPILIPFYFSSNLSKIDVDLGFKASSSSTDDMLCTYFTQVAESCRGLRHLSLRGHASERLNDIISRLSSLHSISLKLGATLLPKTLKAIMDFPRLSELEVHAGHIESYDVNDKQEDCTVFTSLRKLHIRAQSTLIEDILRHIPLNTLQNIHLELDDPSPCTTFWNACFASIANKSAETLQHLSLEHHFEIVEPSLSIPLDAAQPSNASTTTIVTTASPAASHMTFQVVETLRVLKHLHHFSCDITLPPILNDKDIERMVVWWPQLQHFELGSSLPTEELQVSQRPQMTPGCLHFFASQLSQLRKLILPLTIDDDTNLSTNTLQLEKANELQSLTIAQLSTTTPNDVARYLHTLFPSLKSLEGPCDDSDIWTGTIDALRNFAC
ncbi:hypothetical protein HYPSUDRAFT_62437 [Hypholoma sublateritium FD-334 SS-4]|uniref:F-box domain-containing protein n=1 Tax=Hypholoma sublateritium (strain FD-334 SS-4) TaxID=945553 RepID=A0A0D2Q8M1_HYPSF|nr:hypothetical protein HYPSUDRAFT_62437 [Hypholoma sublateritium FD-334 SS-4]